MTLAADQGNRNGNCTPLQGPFVSLDERPNGTGELAFLIGVRRRSSCATASENRG